MFSDSKLQIMTRFSGEFYNFEKKGLLLCNGSHRLLPSNQWRHQAEFAHSVTTSDQGLGQSTSVEINVSLKTQLKTIYQDRGIGIHVFKSISQLVSSILSYTKNIKHDEAADKGREDEKDKNSQENKLKNNLQVFSSPIQITKSMSFIIQKYIERPFLIYNRKFDIRVWVLINQDMEVYFFKEGYLRTSALGYKLDNCQDNMVHLTNNAVQKNAKEYGKFEDGNQLNFA